MDETQKHATKETIGFPTTSIWIKIRIPLLYLTNESLEVLLVCERDLIKENYAFKAFGWYINIVILYLYIYLGLLDDILLLCSFKLYITNSQCIYNKWGFCV